VSRKKKNDGDRRTAGDRDDSYLGSFTAYSAELAKALGTATQQGTGTSLTPALPETVADVPILAFKRCRLRWQPGGKFSLISSHTSEKVALDADAICTPGGGGIYGSGYLWPSFAFTIGEPEKPEKPHQAPGPGCKCGFHAVKEPDQVTAGYGLVTLEVELSGRVVIHDIGYRAQHQRVLAARVDGCYFCGEPVDAFAVNVATEGTAESTVRALCGTHVKAADVTVTPELVAARLDLPFAWRETATS
jgi:hypothetical protein